MFENNHSKRDGTMLAVAAYCIWGIFPLYFKLLAHIPPAKVLAWRCLWTFATLAIILTVLRRWHLFVACFRSWRIMRTLILSMLLVVSNWGFFVYAVSSNQVLQSSLAYFINPLLSVLVGVAFLHERLHLAQVFSIVLATIGVLGITFLGGEFPSLAILLTTTFCGYSYLRKTISGVDSLTGLSVEMALATPLAILAICYIHLSGQPMLDVSTGQPAPDLTFFDQVLLSMTGMLIISVLVLFIAAARRLPLSLLGMLQYIMPTCFFFLAVVVFGEPLSAPTLLSFAFIWVAVGIFFYSSNRKLVGNPQNIPN